MFAAALIVFREVLEAALVVSIILAATRGVSGRSAWIASGILGGVAGAALVASLTSYLASLFEGTGQDILNAVICFVAVVLIGWHVIWMNKHGKEIASELRRLGHNIKEGRSHLSMLAIVVGLAVMREGSEVVLMLEGLWSGSSTPLLLGSFLGLILGVAVGALIYAGFTFLPIGKLFRLTNGLLVMIAAGMAAHGANFLVQAGLISAHGRRIWDTSHILSDQDGLGQFLGALIGYIARPNGVEVLGYFLTITLIAGLIFWVNRPSQPLSNNRM